MSRVFGLLSLLGALVAMWWLLSAAYRELGPKPDREPVAGPLALEKAAEMMEDWRVATGTYAGVKLEGFGGITLVRADETSYCLQLAYGGGTYHREGPNGASALGACRSA